MDNIYLYGPSGSGKSTIGKLLAGQLGLTYYDLDELIVDNAGMDIPQIFALEGEAGFRQREYDLMDRVAQGGAMVIALGGGALLDESSRALAQASGQVVCLSADLETLAQRLAQDANQRPLLASSSTNDQDSQAVRKTSLDELRTSLRALLERRAAHYASFSIQVDTSQQSPEQAAWEIQVRLGRFYITGMGKGYMALAAPGALQVLPAWMAELGLSGPLALVSDSHVAPLYGERLLVILQSAGYAARLIHFPAGEVHKTIATVEDLWLAFLESGLERSSTVLALGGGVVGDLAGFAAATYLRGVPWVCLPTTLLSMVDASLGGKTGADLPQGKNLVGAFHPPSLVLADSQTLGTLPERELRNGLAEVVKHGVIGDPRLFELCEQGWQAVHANLDEIVRRAMAVKIRVICSDPYEQGQRAALNLGHTLGHAIEMASDFQLQHGEAVAIGMVAAASYAERIGLAHAGLAGRLRKVLTNLGLPVDIPPNLETQRLVSGMGVDKKRKGGKVRLALPRQVGDVQVGIPLERAEDLLGL